MTVIKINMLANGTFSYFYFKPENFSQPQEHTFATPGVATQRLGNTALEVVGQFHCDLHRPRYQVNADGNAIYCFVVRYLQCGFLCNSIALYQQQYTSIRNLSISSWSTRFKPQPLPLKHCPTHSYDDQSSTCDIERHMSQHR